jgi:glycosyltransferase involved in cell wall biosynthesis
MTESEHRTNSVWIINHYAGIPTMPGATRHYELARRLVSHGFDVSIVASEFHRKSRSYIGREDSRHGVSMIDGVRFLWIPARIRHKGNSIARMLNMLEFAFRTWRRGRRCFGRQLPQPDVIIGSTPHLLTALAASLLCRRLDARFVLEIRDLWPESLVAVGGYPRWHPLVFCLRPVATWLYRRADHIVSLLPDAWRHLVVKCVKRDGITWIPNGASAALPSVATSSPKDTNKVFRAIYIGSIGRANVLDDLLSAASILLKRSADIQIVIIGDGPRKRPLVQRAREEGLTNVEFRNLIPKTMVPAALDEADAAIALLEDTPLYEYGISLNKLFDYFAAGKPVLFGGRVAHNYLDMAGAGITVAPRCPECIADGLAQLANLSRAERVAMGERGRAYLRTHHDWDVLASRLIDLLRGNLSANQFD